MLNSCSFIFLLATISTANSLDFIYDRNSISASSKVLLERKKALSEGSIAVGSKLWAPEWLQHDSNGLYFPLVHSNVLYQEPSPKENTKRKSRKLLSSEPIEEVVFSLGGNVGMTGSYFISVAVGSSHQVFNLQVDTGSSLMWLPCDCRENECGKPKGHSVVSGPIYYSSYSTSSEFYKCGSDKCKSLTTAPYGNSPMEGAYIGCNLLNKTGSAALKRDENAKEILDYSNVDPNCEYYTLYGDKSSTAGDLITDNLWIHGRDGNQEANVLFGCGKVQSGKEEARTFLDGLIGFGLSDLSVQRQLAKKGVIGQSFSICMEGRAMGGHLVLGRGNYPEDAYKTKQLTSENGVYYTIAVVGINFGNMEVLGNSSGPLEHWEKTVVDSGSTLTFIKRSIFYRLRDMIFSKLNNGEFMEDHDLGLTCAYFEDIAKTSDSDIYLPSIVLRTFGGDPWVIPPSSYLIMDYINNKAALCLSFLPNEFTLMGDTWLKNMDVMFDNENKELRWFPVNCTTGESLYKDKSGSYEQLIDFSNPQASTLRAQSPVPQPQLDTYGNERNTYNSKLDNESTAPSPVGLQSPESSVEPVH